MLPQAIFLNKLIEFLSDENLDIVNMKKGVDKIFSKKDFYAILELNIKIMNIAKLIFKSDEKLNILLPQTSDYKNTNYFLQELELKKEMDVNLNDLKNCDNKKIIEIIKQEYQNNLIKELDINSQKEKIKILFIINEVPKFLKSIYKECEFKEYGLANYLEFDEIWDFYENNIRYFTILTPMGANKIKLRLENTQNSEKESNIIEVNLDKK
ncbi:MULTISPECIES: hypothetical protein [Campylobacter]|uniref:Uncharacterized protein n=1 Tax=Campylobacter jejuni TaxID=197 RepID=A0AB36G159_CAMJU|nr:MULTISPECIES: hypothetical protein [Campylobacter]EHD2890776.1 hypothetical protein [Campylobacter jejuni]OEV44550.1 hypothetical protein AJY60_10395 [Campylobacter jejuni]OEW43482.1 hypothetical protein AJ884_01425 [Campylobacter sp. BCW_6463]OEW76811.1 hypothetical protein AJN64_00045 [Campylobacter sp. BCW_4332]RTI78059.1 hypothetical protein C3I09_09490 [Campylobacter jejuni]